MGLGKSPRQAPGGEGITQQRGPARSRRDRSAFAWRGETLSEAVERALLREMRTPPPPPVEPPPLAPYDAALDAPPKPEVKPKKARKK